MISLIDYIQKIFFKPKIKTSIDSRLLISKELNSFTKEAKFIKDIVENNNKV